MAEFETEKIVDFSTLGQEAKELLQESAKARECSYSPYSKFSVGAALRCDDGSLFLGCNVENSSFGLSICAEQTAIVKAVSEGRRKYRAIAVTANQVNGRMTTPCGACRQIICEFSGSRDILIYITNPDLKKVLVTSARTLLPLGFHFDD